MAHMEGKYHTFNFLSLVSKQMTRIDKESNAQTV